MHQVQQKVKNRENQTQKPVQQPAKKKITTQKPTQPQQKYYYKQTCNTTTNTN